MTTNILTAIVTAYCACKVCCGPTAKGINAAGKTPIEGKSIAVPRRYPLGTKIIINGYTYIADDHLAKRYDDRFDIYFQSHKEARKFGKRELTLTIITK